MTRRSWEERADAAALDDERFDLDAAWLDVAGDPDAQLELDVYRELARAGVPDPLSDEDRRRAEATLAAFRRSRARPWWPRALGGGLAIAAAVLVAWLARPQRDLAEAGSAGVVTSGSLMLDGAVLGPETPLPADRWVVARTPACVRVGAGTSCVDASTRLRAQADRVEVAEGTLHFTGTGDLVTAHGSFAVHDGSLHLETNPAAVTLQVETGAVFVEHDGDVIELTAGERRTFGERPEPPVDTAPELPSGSIADDDAGEAATTGSRSTRSSRAAGPPPGDLLATARNYVAQGKHDRALSTYETLQRRHPSSPEAHAANVSIGELQLSRRRPAAALRAFDRYLARGGGPLSQEAHWGRIRALHQLDRHEQRDAAIETLRSKHPRSVYINQASRL